MSRVVRNEQVLKLNGGINTDASPLDKPEESTSYEQNFVPISNGTMARRYGLQYDRRNELGFPLGTILMADDRPAYGQLVYWPEAYSGTSYYIAIGDTAFVTVYSAEDNNTLGGVSQAQTLYPLSDAPECLQHTRTAYFGGQMYLPSAITATPSTGNSGDLAVYTMPTATSVTYAPSNLFIRDIWGFRDYTPVTVRPALMTMHHAYNLMNAGWTPASIVQFNTDIGAYPARSDVPYFGLGSTGLYDSNLLKQTPIDSGATMGKYYLTSIGEGETRYQQAKADFLALTALGVPGMVSWNTLDDRWDSNDVVWDHAQAHAGRVFYVGYREVPRHTHTLPTTQTPGLTTLVPDLENFLVFSQSIKSPMDLALTTEQYTGEEGSARSCHAVMAPCEQGFQPTAADGGIIPLPATGRVQGIVSMNEGLYVVAEMGVWLVRSPRASFSPLDYTIEQVSKDGCTNPNTIIEVGTYFVYGATNDLHAVAMDAESNRPKIHSIAKQGGWGTLYREKLPHIVAGGYDRASQTGRWVVRIPGEWLNGEAEGVQQELFWRLVSNTAHLHLLPAIPLLGQASIPTNDIQSRDPKTIRGYIQLSSAVDATQYDEIPGASPLDNVPPTDVADAERSYTQLKFFTRGAVAWYSAGSFVDYANTYLPGWEAFDSPAKLVYNYANGGEAQRRKQVGRFTIHTYNTTADPVSRPYVLSSCLMSYNWDYAVNTYYSKGQGPYQMHRPRDGREVSSHAIHPKGSGASFQFTLETEPGKDCQILGWGKVTKINRRQ